MVSKFWRLIRPNSLNDWIHQILIGEAFDCLEVFAGVGAAAGNASDLLLGTGLMSKQVFTWEVAF